MVNTDEADAAIQKARKLFDSSGFTLQQLGEAMGWAPTHARKQAHQFLHRTRNPRIGTLRKFAEAMHIDIRDLV